ncbi:MAG: (2Fe-2S) ferredoxin domain-containing protein [Deltaproteobacteria bacterium]|nr:(2Fe-2S) ferredoxin domain-containing protein [Deltaproteobacteria bacterium]
MPPFEKHILVCTNERPAGHPRPCCLSKNSEAILQAFKEALQQAGLKGKVRANRSGCLDACEKGPAVVVYPEGIWYRVTTVEQAKRIVKEHIVGGKVVSEWQSFK